MNPSPGRLSDALYLLILLLPAGSLVNVLLRPQTAFWGAVAISLTITVVDALWPGAKRSPAPLGPQPLLRLYLPLQASMLLAGLAAAPRLDWLHVAGLAIGVGFVTGSMGITFAHELGHSRSRFDRALGCGAVLPTPGGWSQSGCSARGAAGSAVRWPGAGERTWRSLACWP